MTREEIVWKNENRVSGALLRREQREQVLPRRTTTPSPR
jgi:hypothetical protein